MIIKSYTLITLSAYDYFNQAVCVSISFDLHSLVSNRNERIFQ